MARPHFNPSHAEIAATVGGHRRIALICPVCRETFAINPGAFAQSKRLAKPGRKICCSKPCSAIEQKRRHEEGRD